MSEQQSNNKTIAKNTIFLYFRMLFSMGVGLYTSRVVLQVLGVDDYGIYQSVGGIVGMLSFLNGALSVGSSRYLTYEMGTGNLDKLKRTFSSVLTAHIILAVFIVLLAETVGLWFLDNKVIIPEERMDAAIFAFHFSIVAAFFQITQIPYTASIISHEKMGIYAYMSIAEVSLKLLIVYALYVGDWDKLKLYSLLFCLVNVLIVVVYRVFCLCKFDETHYKPMWDNEIMKNVLGYSGWNLFASTAIALSSQGSILLLNMFFNPSVVAANAISNQVNLAINQFVQNFRTAANPQIVKKYAAGDYEGSKYLLLTSTKFSYYLMLMLALPICLLASPLLNLWLVQVPHYAVIFLQFAIITSLFQVFDSSFYTALYAKGRIWENALISPTLLLVAFPIMYFLFIYGMSPIVMSVTMLCVYAIIGLIVKPILIIKIVDYSWSDVFSVFKPCLLVTLFALPLPLTAYFYLDVNESLCNTSLVFIVSVFSVGVASWYVGVDSEMKGKVVELIKSRINT